MSKGQRHARPTTVGTQYDHADKPLSRRTWLGLTLGGAATAFVARRLSAERASPFAVGTDPAITVFASPTCKCCERWVDHLETNAIKVTLHKVGDVTPYKRKFGVPEKLWSCHTGTIGPYVIEGHVPVDLIEKMLIERPAILGLAVPGMPKGAPGMDSDTPERYDVIAFKPSGDTEVYATR